MFIKTFRNTVNKKKFLMKITLTLILCIVCANAILPILNRHIKALLISAVIQGSISSFSFKKLFLEAKYSLFMLPSS